MQDKQIISAAVDALTGKKILSFTLINKVPDKIERPKPIQRTFLDKLFRRPIVELPSVVEPILSRTFDIYPCVVANQYRIAGKALSLPDDLFEDQSIMLAYVPEHLPTMVYIIAAAITNTYEEPTDELIQYLERNLDNEYLMSVLAASLQQTNMQAFTISITLMNGVAKILTPEVSPLDGSELIASHTQI